MKKKGEGVFVNALNKFRRIQFSLNLERRFSNIINKYIKFPKTIKVTHTQNFFITLLTCDKDLGIRFFLWTESIKNVKQIPLKDLNIHFVMKIVNKRLLKKLFYLLHFLKMLLVFPFSNNI